MLLRSSSLPGDPHAIAEALALHDASPGRRRRRRWGLILLVLLFAAGVISLVADLGRFVGRCRHFSRVAATAGADLPQPVIREEAVVVLTGDHGRIRRALELLRKRGSPLLVISGTGRGATLTALVNQQGDATNTQEIWTKIIVDPISGSTVENAFECAKIFRTRHTRRVILVTSDYHMERSLDIFRAVAPGPKYFPYPVASEVAELHWGWSSTAPTALWKMWFEYWKYMLYKHYQSRFGGTPRGQ